jgi:hypothetical protein
MNVLGIFGVENIQFLFRSAGRRVKGIALSVQTYASEATYGEQAVRDGWVYGNVCRRDIW